MSQFVVALPVASEIVRIVRFAPILPNLEEIIIVIKLAKTVLSVLWDP
jgi:hypothetical protein